MPRSAAPAATRGRRRARTRGTAGAGAESAASESSSLTPSRVPSTSRRSFSAVSHACASLSSSRLAAAVFSSVSRACRRPERSSSAISSRYSRSLPASSYADGKRRRREGSSGSASSCARSSRGREARSSRSARGSPSAIDPSRARSIRLRGRNGTQSRRMVAQRPCAWRRETSYSIFSRVPLETTALPSWCTWSMSFVACSWL